MISPKVQDPILGLQSIQQLIYFPTLQTENCKTFLIKKRDFPMKHMAFAIFTKMS